MVERTCTCSKTCNNERCIATIQRCEITSSNKELSIGSNGKSAIFPVCVKATGRLLMRGGSEKGDPTGVA